MPAAAPVAHARSKDPSGSPASVTATEMNMEELLYRSPGTTHINGPGWTQSPRVRLAAHFGGQVTGTR
jgi:hypothetical protein